MGRIRFAVLAGTASLALSATVYAQNAYTTREANVRAGPDPSYPLVARIDAGTPVDVVGCLDDWSWCDVVFDDTRGWMYAPLLAYVYQDERVPLYTYAPSLGLPIITFSLGAYWDRYYRGRPWYGQRGEWERRHIPHRRPPGPPPRAGLPPPPGAAGRGFVRPGGPRPGGLRQRGGGAVPPVPERGPRVNPGRPNSGREAGPPGREVRPPGREARPPARAAVPPPRETGPRTAIPQRRGAPPPRGVPQTPRGQQGRSGDQGRGGEHQGGRGDNRRGDGQGGPPR